MKSYHIQSLENKTQAAANHKSDNTTAIQLKDNREHSVIQQRLSKQEAQTTESLKEVTSKRNTQPIQLVASERKFRKRRTRYASRSDGKIGSIYAQKKGDDFNRGHRIRLEHKSGPHLSKRSFYRHVLHNEIRTPLLNGEIGGMGVGKLVETRRLSGRIKHTSRGAIGDMEPLNKKQVKAIYNAAKASDDDRVNIGINRTHPNKDAHAAHHNQLMRTLLRKPLFASHELGISQTERDTAGGVNP